MGDVDSPAIIELTNSTAEDGDPFSESAAGTRSAPFPRTFLLSAIGISSGMPLCVISSSSLSSEPRDTRLVGSPASTPCDAEVPSALEEGAFSNFAVDVPGLVDAAGATFPSLAGVDELKSAKIL